MNITYILGNGFDLQLGLKTRYSDFLENYSIPQSDDNENIKKFKVYLQNDAKREQEWWSNAEKAMGIHHKEIPNLTIDEYVERIWDFGTSLKDYLLAQQERCSWENESEIEKIFKSFVLNSYKDIFNQRGNDFTIENLPEPHSYSFITFNYTNLIDRLVYLAFGGSGKVAKERTVQGSLRRDTIGKIYHVHGDLNKGIIMGVNDESQILLRGDEKLTDELRWKLVKSEMNFLSNQKWDKPAKKIIQESKVIFIFGVSFGVTDNQWWEAISEWLRKDKTNKIIVFKYETNLEDISLSWQKIDYEVQKRRETLNFLGFQNDDPDFNRLMNQIYIIRNTERLNLSSVLGTDIEEEDIAAGRVIWENPTEV